MKFQWKNTVRWMALTVAMGIATGLPALQSQNTSIVITVIIFATFVWKDLKTQWQATGNGKHNIYYVILAVAAYFLGFGGSAAVSALTDNTVDALSFALAAGGLVCGAIATYKLKGLWLSSAKTTPDKN